MNSTESDDIEKFRESWSFCEEFNKAYEKEKEKLPYHINLIDELHANENAHSRILCKLLQQQNPENKKYEVLESLVGYICEKHRQKEEFKRVKVEQPQITKEKEHIDLWIEDKDYTIIFENKIAGANDQPTQLARYIDTAKERYAEEKIYVVYLPPTYDKESREDTWGKYYDHDIRTKRSLSLSFKDDILPWLKNDVLPNIRLKDKYLSSAVEQYIDHIEGKFSLRTINNKMNMELHEFIKKTLGIDNVSLDMALKRVSQKRAEIEDVLTHLWKVQDEIDEAYFSTWYNELKQLELEPIWRIGESEGYEKPKSVGVKFANGIAAWLGVDTESPNKGKLFCQVHTKEGTLLDDKTINVFKKMLCVDDIEKNEAGYAIWVYLNDRPKALEDLKKLCKELK